MLNQNRRNNGDRRKEERRRDNRGIQDRRGMDRRKIEVKEERTFDDQVEGRNAVLELLESGKDINKIFITKGDRHGSINKIIKKNG